VPLGILLSGGIDSSLITAIAARVSSQPIKTFTISFPGGGGYDEGPHARVVADHFNTEHYELPVPSGDLETLRTIATHLDEPIADPSILPTYLVSRMARQYITVALGGDGGDELFGGYSWYRLGLRTQRILKLVPRTLRRMAASIVSGLPVGLKGRNYIRSIGDDLCYHRIVGSSIFDIEMRRHLFSLEMLEKLGDSLDAPERYIRSHWLQGENGVLQMSALDLKTFLPDDILFKVDRASMAFALEVRAPLLDYRIVEFAFCRIPSMLKVNAGGNRFLQRRLAERFLPSSLDLTRKQGFVIPVHRWMAGEWGDETLRILADMDGRHLLNLDFIQGLLRGQRKGYSNGVRLFACLVFGLWAGVLNHQT
jgi:asparagine synthase (glutamine-hydrolysing)